jgi:translocation and assembly module TamB
MSGPASGSPAPSAKKRGWRKLLFWMALPVLLLCALLYLNSNAFHSVLRHVAVSRLEKITGGKVEMQSFSPDIFHLRFQVQGLTIHGLEGRGQPSYFHADKVNVHAQLLSFLQPSFAFKSVTFEHPVIHLIIHADGSTSQLVPYQGPVGQDPVKQLFSLEVGHLDVKNGELFLNDQRIPFEVSGEGLNAGMTYSTSQKKYESAASLDSVVARYQNLRPIRGSLAFTLALAPSQMELKSLKFSTGRSSLEASGTVTNFNRPEISLHYTGSLDAAELAAMTGAAQVRGGHIDIEGVGAFANHKYLAQGTVAGRNFQWEESSLRLTGIDFSSPFTASAEKLELPRLTVRTLGGIAQGNVQITNWSAAPGTAEAARQRGSANLKVANLQSAQLARLLSTQRLPLEKINPVGTISGVVNTTWAGSARNAIAELKLEVDAPATIAPGEVPITAQLEATFRNAASQIDVATLNLATPAMRLSATGSLGNNATRLKVAFNARDMHELQPVLQAFSPEISVPPDVSRRASFTGVVYGPFKGLSANGRLELEDFDSLLITALALPNGTFKPSGQIRWDSFTGDVTYMPSGLSTQNGLLKRGPAQFAFSGSVGLTNGVFVEESSQITALLRMQNADMTELQSLLGKHYPVTGLLSGDLQATGLLNSLRGSGKIEASKITLYGEPFRTLRSDVNFAGGEARLNHIVLEHNGSQISGAAGYRFLDKTFRFDLSGKNIELANFRRFQPQRLSMQGKMDFHAEASGTLPQPEIHAQFNFHKLVLNGEEVGDMAATAETHGPELLVRAQSNFENAALTLDGSMQMRDNFPGQFTIKFQHLDFDPLIRAYLRGKITGHSSMEGYIDVHGPMKTPRALTIAANITQLSADVENVKVHNEGPIRFSMGNESLHVLQAHLVGDDTDMSLHGDVQIASPYGLDLNADGHLNMKLLRTFRPNLVSSGMSTFAIHFTGTASQPETRGRVDISNGALAIADLPNGLTQINGRLTLAQDRLVIDNLTAHTGGGDLALGGFIAYRTGLFFDVTATGNDVRLRYPPGISAAANASLHYRGSEQSSQLSGTITILRFAMDQHFDFAQYLGRSNGPARPTQNPFLDNLRLDVHIISTPELRVETSLAKLSGDADLHIRGTVANPSVLGRVNIAEGNISFSGTKYQLQRGDITFSNPQVIQPLINVEMAARVRGYDISIGFHGPVEKLGITYRSDPPLPSGDIIALLAFGRTRDQDLYSNQNTQTLTTSDIVLSQALNSASNSRVQKLFGVGSVKIDPQYVGGAENNIGPRVTIEQQIKNNLTLTYITNLANTSSEQIIQVEYNLTRNISVVAVRDQNGILGFDVRIRKRRR